MNIRTGLKTIAVALPMGVAPMKSSAQSIAKETSQVVVHTMKGTKVLKGPEADAYMKNIEARLEKAEAQKKGL